MYDQPCSIRLTVNGIPSIFDRAAGRGDVGMGLREEWQRGRLREDDYMYCKDLAISCYSVVSLME